MIAHLVGIGRTAVGEYLRRAAVVGITWPIPDGLDDTGLERKLFAPAGQVPPEGKPLPDWSHVHGELRRRGVTLLLLWQEYRAGAPDGYGFSMANGVAVSRRPCGRAMPRGNLCARFGIANQPI